MTEIDVALAIKAGELLLATLYDKISGELSLLTGLREEVHDIVRELKVMNAWLRDAEQKPVSSETARTLVSEVNELAYDIEDCLEKVSLHLEDRFSQDIANTNLQHLRRLTFCCISLGDRYCIANEMQNIKSRAEKLDKIKQRYGIGDVISSSGSDQYNGARLNSQLPAHFEEDSQLVGIDERRKKLLHLLDQSKPGIRLIAVVGGGGIGKTTLARKAYEALNFTCRAWVTVSQVYQIEGILRDMTKQLGHSAGNDLGSVELAKKLREYLKNKRYLIVFDDIWNQNAWEDLRHVLPTNNLGSRVILTTRNIMIANCCRPYFPTFIYKQEKLSLERSMELFCKRVFSSPEHICPDELKEVSQAFLEKCDGLPLAIVSIAGLLASKPNKTRQEWESIHSHLGSMLEGALKGAERILTFSYNDLPDQVKPCLLYLSKFPEDYTLERKRIQRLWIAEGFVAGHDGMTADVVAECYFNELANRFLILPTSFSDFNGKVKSFRLHDIMLELILSKSKEEKFLCVFGKNGNSWEPDVMIRRLSIHECSSSMNQSNLCRVKSIFVLEVDIEYTTLLTLLSQSLGLKVFHWESGSFNSSLSLFVQMKFFHLKYLCLRGRAAKVHTLAISSRNLPNLEYLDVRETRICEITKEMTRLRKLRYLYGYFNIIHGDVGRLRFLQELSVIEINSDYVLREIGKLTQLRKLEVKFVYRVGVPLHFNHSLQSLKVRATNPPDLGFLENLSSPPPPLLERLRLHGHLRTLPSWIASLNNLFKIELLQTQLEGKADINLLGSLPRLIYILLIADAFIGESLSFGAEKFPSLKVLRLENLGSVRSISFEAGTMPHLELLEVSNWDKHYEHKRMTVSGIRNLPKLKEVKIRKDSIKDLTSLRVEIWRHQNNPVIKLS